MTTASTQDQLLLLAYGELPLLERLETEFAIEQSAALRAEYRQLQSTLAELPKVKFAPHPSTLDAILGYSRNSTFEPTI